MSRKNKIKDLFCISIFFIHSDYIYYIRNNDNEVKIRNGVKQRDCQFISWSRLSPIHCDSNHNTNDNFEIFQKSDSD